MSNTDTGSITVAITASTQRFAAAMRKVAAAFRRMTESINNVAPYHSFMPDFDLGCRVCGGGIHPPGRFLPGGVVSNG